MSVMFVGLVLCSHWGLGVPILLRIGRGLPELSHSNNKKIVPLLWCSESKGAKQTLLLLTGLGHDIAIRYVRFELELEHAIGRTTN